MGQAGLRFWKTDDDAVDFRLTCWLDGYGICGTGVTEQELTLSGGQTAWQYTEGVNDNVWVNVVFRGTPGSYVCMPDDDGAMDRAAWDGCRDEVWLSWALPRSGGASPRRRKLSSWPGHSTMGSMTWPTAGTM